MKVYGIRILDITQNELYKLYSTIDLERKYIIDRMINKKDKLRMLMGEILIRTIITKELGIKNKFINFDRTRYGKPYLNEYSKFNFSISHSGDFVLCAIDEKSIGIDIEEIKYIRYEEIYKRYFTISEVKYITKTDHFLKQNKFYEIWTLKESYIKCCGRGLSIDLKSFSINIDENKNISIVVYNDCNKYSFRGFDIGLDYKVAICSLNQKIPVNITMIEQSNLINRYYN